MQVRSSLKDPLLEMAEEISALKLGFNKLSEELQLLKTRLSSVEEALSSLRIYIEALQDSFEIKSLSLKTYAKIVSRIESRIVLGEAREH